ADRIEPIPPAVAVRQRSSGGSRRATVGTLTEIYDYLRLLFGRWGKVECPSCRRPVEKHTPATVERVLAQLDAGRKFIVCFPAGSRSRQPANAPGSNAPGPEPHSAAQLLQAGFSRVIVAGTTISLTDGAPQPRNLDGALVMVDRLTAGGG